MVEYLYLDIICSEFYNLGKLFASRNMIFADKYPSIFSRQMHGGYCVLFIEKKM